MNQTPIFPAVVRRLDAKLARDEAWREHRSRIVPRAPRSAPATVDWAVQVLQAGVFLAAARFATAARRLDAGGEVRRENARATSAALVQLAEACEVLAVAADYLADAARSVYGGVNTKVEDAVVNTIASIVRAFGAEQIDLPPEEKAT